jgi:DNA polymerase-3 subunit gamma/tau
MDLEKLSGQLIKILQAEKIEFDADAIMVLSRSADGSVRDALSLLDQAIAFGNGSVRVTQVRSMLGMIDDQFTQELLEKVCARDGPGLMETVARMSERSLDYRSALDEILSALHNAALYQVNPQAIEWKGVDRDAVAPLAALADAELLQLLFQIALIGKRDLGLAPDPRTGFEMILLRMNAFQPAASAQPAQELAPNTEKTPNRPTAIRKANKKTVSRNTSPEKIITASEAVVTEKVADGEMVTATSFTLEMLASQAGWTEFVEGSGLSGISRELVMNMIPRSLDGHHLHLLLDQKSRHLLNQSRLKKIEQHCAETLGLEIRLKLDVDDIEQEEAETPSQQKQRYARERQKSAEQAFNQDQNVQTLVELFDAEIVPESIQPPTK